MSPVIKRDGKTIHLPYPKGTKKGGKKKLPVEFDEWFKQSEIAANAPAYLVTW